MLVEQALKRNKQFTCAGCGANCISSSEDGEAEKEFHDNFPTEPLNQSCAIICDNCYKIVKEKFLNG